MRNFLTFLGGMMLLLIVVVIGAFIFMFIQLGPAQKEAEAYARESIVAIAGDWEAQAIYDRASSALKETLKEAEIVALMEQGARMVGKLETLSDVECETNSFTSTSEGKVVTSKCTASGQHRNGSVDYTIGVEKRNDIWSMLSFHYNITATQDGPTDV